MVAPHIHPEDMVALSSFYSTDRNVGCAFLMCCSRALKWVIFPLNVPHENRLACPQIIWIKNNEIVFKSSPIEICLGADENS